MDSRKLSYQELADECEAAATPLSATSSKPAYRAAVALCKAAAVIRALAQQAQPLTDEMIEAKADAAYPPRDSETERRSFNWHAFVYGARFARDRMAQQVLPCPVCLAPNEENADGASSADVMLGTQKHYSTQQAQPLTDSELGALKVVLRDDVYADDEVGETLRALVARLDTNQ